ncbi:MAG: pyruvate kinase, partial [Halobacteria archaeon]|nr:pyruvate kinase [Halobacteria archaeon]
MRRTKIIATLGPATDDPKVMDRIIEAGVDVVRINFSHGSHEEHKERAEKVRNRARAHGRQVGVLCDLQGPKIRIERFKDGKVSLTEGDTFILDTELDPKAGTNERVGMAYKALPEDVSRGDTLLLDDGRIVLWVDSVEGSEVHCRVVVGGELSDRKGLNRQGGGLTAPALTQKDREDIKAAAEIQADYLAVSFPRTADDIEEARRLLQEAGGYADIVAKIERADALDNAEALIEASDAIMIARGDLGVEIGDAALPPVQKRLIRQARSLNRVVITATQMMESMIYSHIPTR